MEQSTNKLHPEAATDEPASSLGFQQDGGPARADSASPETATRLRERRPAEPPGSAEPSDFAEPPLLSDCLEDALADTLAETFPPDGRKPRHDGWTPEVVAGFLRALAAAGVVEHAARAVGRSVASAYALRNRREGRAFAKMWDAVLIHRARARLASELQGRAIAGCVSVRRRDGEIVGEYHYYDNRLAMALLTRLDRIAEREEESEAHLRSLSEDLDEFCDCLAAGGDADAFVEARQPDSGEAEEPDTPAPDDDFRAFAEPEDNEEFTGGEVWQGEDEIWWTEFPPPAAFDGIERGSPGDLNYRRTLSDSERAVIEAEVAEERGKSIADEAVRRDRYFGFVGGLAEEGPFEPGEFEDEEAFTTPMSGRDAANPPPDADCETDEGPEK